MFPQKRQQASAPYYAFSHLIGLIYGGLYATCMYYFLVGSDVAMFMIGLPLLGFYALVTFFCNYVLIHNNTAEFITSAKRDIRNAWRRNKPMFTCYVLLALLTSTAITWLFTGYNAEIIDVEIASWHVPDALFVILITLNSIAVFFFCAYWLFGFINTVKSLLILYRNYNRVTRWVYHHITYPATTAAERLRYGDGLEKQFQHISREAEDDATTRPRREQLLDSLLDDGMTVIEGGTAVTIYDFLCALDDISEDTERELVHNWILGKTSQGEHRQPSTVFRRLVQLVLKKFPNLTSTSQIPVSKLVKLLDHHYHLPRSETLSEAEWLSLIDKLGLPAPLANEWLSKILADNTRTGDDHEESPEATALRQALSKRYNRADLEMAVAEPGNNDTDGDSGGEADETGDFDSLLQQRIWWSLADDKRPAGATDIDLDALLRKPEDRVGWSPEDIPPEAVPAAWWYKWQYLHEQDPASEGTLRHRVTDGNDVIVYPENRDIVPLKQVYREQPWQDHAPPLGLEWEAKLVAIHYGENPSAELACKLLQMINQGKICLPLTGLSDWELNDICGRLKAANSTNTHPETVSSTTIAQKNLRPPPFANSWQLRARLIKYLCFALLLAMMCYAAYVEMTVEYAHYTHSPLSLHQEWLDNTLLGIGIIGDALLLTTITLNCFLLAERLVDRHQSMVPWSYGLVVMLAITFLFPLVQNALGLHLWAQVGQQDWDLLPLIVTASTALVVAASIEYCRRRDDENTHHVLECYWRVRRAPTKIWSIICLVWVVTFVKGIQATDDDSITETWPSLVSAAIIAYLINYTAIGAQLSKYRLAPDGQRLRTGLILAGLATGLFGIPYLVAACGVDSLALATTIDLLSAAALLGLGWCATKLWMRHVAKQQKVGVEQEAVEGTGQGDNSTAASTMGMSSTGTKLDGDGDGLGESAEPPRTEKSQRSALGVNQLDPRHGRGAQALAAGQG